MCHFLLVHHFEMACLAGRRSKYNTARVIPKTQKWYLISPCLALSIIRYISRVKLSNPRKRVAIEEVGGQLVRPYAALYIKLVCMAVTPERSLFWRRYTRKPPNSLLKTCQQSTWITGTMFYGQMRWRLICFVLMCGGDPVRSTEISVSCLQSSMVVVMSWSKIAWVLQVLESYISLRETWTPTYTVKYCCGSWSPPSRNWFAGQCSIMKITPNTPPRRPLLYWRGWG